MAAIPPSDRFGCFVGAPVVQPAANGLLVAVKDNIDVAGLPTGAGLGRPGAVAAVDAPIVALLRAAGFGIIGKARMNEAAFGATGDNPHQGRTQNPAVPGCSPGGSSSGSAAAIAAGLADAALGTDTLGSVRIPAAFCGLVGLKPTRGVLPMAGIVPLSPTLDHAGLLARDAVTLQALLRVFLPEPEALPPGRIGVPDALDGMPIAPVVRTAFEAGLRALAAKGWTVAPCRIAGWNPNETRRAALLLIEAEGAVVYADDLARHDPALSDATQAMLRYGRDCGTGRLVRALQLLRDAEAGWNAVLADHAMIALPTVASTAFAWTDGAPAGLSDLVAPANWPGLPAISVPLPGMDAPAGMQLVGRAGDDWRLVQAAAALAKRRTP